MTSLGKERRGDKTFKNKLNPSTSTQDRIAKVEFDF